MNSLPKNKISLFSIKFNLDALSSLLEKKEVHILNWGTSMQILNFDMLSHELN